jgi:hypothetical protein
MFIQQTCVQRRGRTQIRLICFIFTGTSQDDAKQKYIDLANQLKVEFA